MANYDDMFSGRDFKMRLAVNETSTNTAANTSVVSWSLKVFEDGDVDAFRNFNDGVWNVYIDNVRVSRSTTWNYNFEGSVTTLTLASGTRTITHDADGSYVIDVSADVDGKSPLGVASKSGTLTLTDFSRPPSAPPSSPTVTRASDGLSLTITSAVAESAVSVSDYEAQFQAVGSSTWTPVSLGTDRVGTTSVPSSTSSYHVETRAISSEGSGGWSATTTIAGLPTAPASISTSRTGRNVTVTSGSSTGTGITSYSVQYSTNDGSTWSSAVTMVSQTHTYASLTAGQTYLFRTYSTNSIGNSATTVSSSVFVPAGGRRFDGSTFTPTATAKRWDGSAWVDITTAKRWTGTTWGDLS
jgi:hypothetical protein